MYRLTDEDKAGIQRDMDDLEQASIRAITTYEQVTKLHVACPVAKATVWSLMEALLEERPALRVLNVLTNQSVKNDLVAMLTIAFFVGVNLQEYPTMFPCTENHPDHLHEFEAMLADIEKNLNKGDGDEG
jgi:hypothetical protein